MFKILFRKTQKLLTKFPGLATSGRHNLQVAGNSLPNGLSTGCLHCVSKKRPTFKLSLILSYLNRFSKRMKFAIKPYDNTHLTLGMLLHYLGKLNIQIFCRYERKRKQNALLIASN